MIRSMLSALAGLALSACATSTPRPATITAPTEQRQPVTILISIDGFRPDYLGKGNTPAIDALAARGVKAVMRPSFPTKTFPNHYTLVTGLRPDRHGITGNYMVDARRPGVMFTLSTPKQSQDPFWWDEAEPIWVTAEKRQVRTGVMFWPGADVKIRGTYPSDWVRYYDDFSYSQRVRTVIDWLRRPAAERPRFLTLYFQHVDDWSHELGPFAPRTIEAVREADASIGDLLARLHALGQPANIVLVSDHGMVEVSPDRTIQLDTLLPAEDYVLIGTGGPFAELNPKPGREAAVEESLLKQHAHMQCWRKGEIPARFRFGKHPRVGAIFCLAEHGWEVMQGTPSWLGNRGDHGFDNDDPDMAALFVASGPSIRQGAPIPIKFDNVDVYPLLAALIGIAPLPSDGDAGTLRPILRTDGN
jgi:predicted AlkP superfamily pyrophosphatase or phosphodiesterase